MKRISALVLLSILVFVLVGCDLLTPSGTLTGKVTDKLSGSALSGAVVSIGSESVTTGTDGSYTLKVKEGTQNVKVVKTGYAEFTTTYVVEGKTSKTLDIPMVPNPDATIVGAVTDGRGGPGVADATVDFLGYTTTTNPDGSFELAVKAGFEGDILVTGENRGSVRVQDFIVANANETRELDIPTRPIFNPNWSDVPPTVTLSGIEPGATVSGLVEFNFTLSGDHDIFVFYAYVGGEQRVPTILNGVNIDVADGAAKFDSTQLPNGETFIKILGYDVNENGVLYYFPVVINNEANDAAVPADMGPVNIITSTFGQNFGYYMQTRKAEFAKYGINDEERLNIIELQNGAILDLRSFTTNTTIRNSLSWAEVTGADGYHVYRSFDEGTEKTWTKIGSILASQSRKYDDYSSALDAEKDTYYRVVPYNSFGEGKGLDVMTMALPPYNVNLLTPANEATNVPLIPTLTWEHDFSMLEEPGIYYTNYLHVFDNTNYQILDVEFLDGENSYTLESALNPGSVYTWDIYDGYAEALVRYDATGYSIAVSFLNGQATGSLNGEFIFTTTTTVGQ